MEAVRGETLGMIRGVTGTRMIDHVAPAQTGAMAEVDQEVAVPHHQEVVEVVVEAEAETITPPLRQQTTRLTTNRST